MLNSATGKSYYRLAEWCWPGPAMCTMGSADSQRTGAQQFPRVATPSLATAMAAPVCAPCPARSAHRVYNVEPPRLSAITSTAADAVAVAAVCLPRAIHYEIIPASRRAVPPRRSPDRTCGACVSVSVRDAQWCSRAGSASEYAVCHDRRHSVLVAFILSWNTVHEMRPGKKKQKHTYTNITPVSIHPSFTRFTRLHNLLHYNIHNVLSTTAYSYIITTLLAITNIIRAMTSYCLSQLINIPTGILKFNQPKFGKPGTLR